MATKKSAANSGMGINIIMVAIIAVVFILGAYAVYTTISGNVKENNLESYNATIAERADTLGMETGEFLKIYGLADSGLKGSDNEQLLYEKMTLGNYVKYAKGTAPTLAELKAFKEAVELDQDVTLDTTDLNIKYQYMTYLDSLEQETEQTEETNAVDIGEAETADETDAGQSE